MAFTVTPTSGAQPYFLSADVTGVSVINGIYYTASVRSGTGAGSCPAEGLVSPLPPERVNPIINGIPTDSGSSSVPAGSCRVFTLTIRRVSDNVVVATSNATVSNL